MRCMSWLRLLVGKSPIHVLACRLRPVHGTFSWFSPCSAAQEQSDQSPCKATWPSANVSALARVLVVLHG